MSPEDAQNGVNDCVEQIRRRIEDLLRSDSPKTSSLLGELSALEKLEIDRATLRITRIGHFLTKLSKLNLDEQIVSKCLSLIRKWREDLRAENYHKRQKISSDSNSTNSTDPTIRNSEGQDRKCSASWSESQNCPPYSGRIHNVPHRDKALAHLYKCFMVGKNFEIQGDISELIYSIESSLFSHFIEMGNDLKGYNLQLKSIAFNLKDTKNASFNLRIYEGSIKPAQLATMSSVEMASDEKKLERNSILQESLQACQSDWSVKNIFLKDKQKGQFTCGKCRSGKTMYHQAQTRSSDEPMTTFVACLSCGHRWRF